MNGQSDPRVASSLSSAPWFMVSFLLMGVGYVLSLSNQFSSPLALLGVVVAALRPETLFTPVWALLVYCIIRMILPGWMFGKHSSGAVISGSVSFLLLAVVYHDHIVPFLAARREITTFEQDTWFCFHLATAISTALALIFESVVMRFIEFKVATRIDES